MIGDGMEWGLKIREIRAISALLVVSDRKPTEAAMSKIESVLTKKPGSRSEWNELQSAWSQGVLSLTISISISFL